MKTKKLSNSANLYLPKLNNWKSYRDLQRIYVKEIKTRPHQEDTMSKASTQSDFLFLCRGMCTQTAAKWTQALSNAVALLDDLAFRNTGTCELYTTSCSGLYNTSNSWNCGSSQLQEVPKKRKRGNEPLDQWDQDDQIPRSPKDRFLPAELTIL